MTIVVDRATRELVGAAMACPDASAAIHECVLAIKARIPVDVLAETIHAFPSTSRILNGLFAEALADPGRTPGPLTGSTARRVPYPPATTSPSSSTSRGRACHRAPPTSTGSVDGGRRDHDEVRSVPGDEPSRGPSRRR